MEIRHASDSVEKFDSMNFGIKKKRCPSTPPEGPVRSQAQVITLVGGQPSRAEAARRDENIGAFFATQVSDRTPRLRKGTSQLQNVAKHVYQKI